ncbi:hypothetical protein JHK86_016338 [Glycine max]|nr:hypothetical protein JHK86_016338 [Glycine max]
MTHDVFVSFRGEDIHTSFTGFLFQALGRKCTIVVFSINYAFSTIRNKLQYAELEDIVEKIITNMLGHKFSSLPNDDLLLRLGSVNDIQLVGISRMGGIGKTTIGHAFYVEISHQYDFCCFIDDRFAIYARAWIVLNNVDQVEQLKMFTCSRCTLLRECLGIIILRRHGVDDVYQVQTLDQEHVVQLFCKNAFKSNYAMSDYKRLTCDVLSHAQGHSVAIEVLGSSVFGRDVKRNYSKNIMDDVLQISFDELEDIEKEIFLDIACLFYLQPVQYLMEVIHFRGFHLEMAFNFDYKILGFHFSRIADYLEALVFKNESSFPQNIIRADALCKMSHRKLLVLDKMNFSGRLDNLSNELRYLTWDIYPFEGLLPSFDPDKLVGLLLPNSNIKQLWEDTKTAKFLPSYHISILGLNSLEYLILNDCSKLYLLPSSPIFPCIYKLDLSFCNLLQIPDAIGNLCCLESLDLSGNNFAGLLNLKELSILFHLNLQHCKQLKHLPELPSRIDFPSHLLTCFSWMIQIVQVYMLLPSSSHLSSYLFSLLLFVSELGTNIQLCLHVTLGNEIPRWFNNQHLGSLISIDASPIMDDNNWIDIACCAIFVVRYETVLAMGPSKTKERYPFKFLWRSRTSFRESDHMWLLFLSERLLFIEECHLQANLGSMKQEFKIISYKPGFDVEVKKY